MQFFKRMHTCAHESYFRVLTLSSFVNKSASTNIYVHKVDAQRQADALRINIVAGRLAMGPAGSSSPKC